MHWRRAARHAVRRTWPAALLWLVLIAHVGWSYLRDEQVNLNLWVLVR